MEYKIPARLIVAAYECAGNDKSRPMMMGVRLMITGEKWQAFGTNGYILCRSSTYAAHGGTEGLDLYFTAETCKLMASHLKLHKNGMGWVDVEEADDGSCVKILGEVAMFTKECPNIYPNCKRIIPDEWQPLPTSGEGPLEVYFSTRYLAKIDKIAKIAAHPKAPSVRMHIQGKQFGYDGVHFEMSRICDDGDMTAHVVLTSMRF